MPYGRESFGNNVTLSDARSLYFSKGLEAARERIDQPLAEFQPSCIVLWLKFYTHPLLLFLEFYFWTFRVFLKSHSRFEIPASPTLASSLLMAAHC